MKKSGVLTFISMTTFVSTLLLIVLYFNGIDPVQDKFVFPLIMLGILLTFYFISKVENSKIKKIGLGIIGSVVTILFLCMAV